MALKTAFISSVMRGYEDYRAAVAQAVTDLGMAVVVIDDQPSSPDTPRAACLGLVGEADITILLTGDRYGYRLQPDSLSATHQEFKEAQRLRKPILVFVHDGVTEDEDLREFRTEAEDWHAGAVGSAYSDPDELRSAVTRSLHRLLQDHARGIPDGADLAALAGGLIQAEVPSRQRRSGSNELIVAFALAPRQSVLRPAEMEPIADTLGMILVTKRIMALAEGCTAVGSPDQVQLSNDSMRVVLSPSGDLTVRVSLDRESSASFGMAQQIGAIVEESVMDGIDTAFRVSDCDHGCGRRTRTLTWVGVAAMVMAGDYATWKTRAEIDASPNTMGMSLSGAPGAEGPVTLAPQQRVGLTADRDRLVQDLVAVLRASSTSQT